MWIIIALIVLGVAAALYWFVVRKPPELPGETTVPVLRPSTPKPADVATSAPPASDLLAPKESVSAQTQLTQETDDDVTVPRLDMMDAAAFSTDAEASSKPDQDARPSQVIESRLPPTRLRDVKGLRKGLGKSRGQEGFFGRLVSLLSGGKKIDPELLNEMEELLLTSDVGVTTTQAMLDRLREGMEKKELNDPDKVWGALRAEAKRILTLGKGGIVVRSKPTVVLFVGVNGAGKTTTIGKIATQLDGEKKTVVLAAGDTFRAAAVQQLEIWGKRVGCDVVKGKDGADPGSVIFDSIRQAIDKGADVVLADTAGRLHTKTPLMDELKKVAKTMSKALEGAPHETLLVIDATNGQNAIAQSKQFAEALPLTGIVLTKVDGTAKGGVVLGICDALGLPIRYIGVGERADDLRPFHAEEFVEALLGQAEDGEEVAA